MMLSDLSFWVFVVCTAAFVIGVGWLIKSFRDARFAQYFFLREEAALRVKRLMFVLLPLAIVVVFLGMRLYGQKDGMEQEPTGTEIAAQRATDTPTAIAEQTTDLSATPTSIATVTTIAPDETATITPTLTAMPTATVVVIEPQVTAEVATVPSVLTEESPATADVTATATAVITATTTPSITITGTTTVSPTVESTVITPTGTLTDTVQPSPTPTATSTPIFSTITPNPGATIENLVFSRAITPDYKPRNPGTTFSTGDNYIYAFFEYHGMNNGVVWRHVWSRGSEQLFSEDNVWEFGSDGQAYVFFSPIGGYTPGRYKVQIYVGNELKRSSEFVIR